MKILQTGDWHLGKLVHGIHMTEDQRHILKQLISFIEEENPDVLIITGDIYDRSIPPVEAVELLDETLTRIVVDLKVKVIIIAGNHDSPDRLAFGSTLLEKQGLFIVGSLQTFIEPIIIMDDYGEVAFYPIPYSEPVMAKHIFGDDGIANHDDAMKSVLSRIKGTMDPLKRNVVIAHGFVMGTETLETSESERPLSIGGSEYISASHFEGFDYVALGHLHRPQKVMRETIRYAGSLLKYSFSEAAQRKAITVVELNHKNSFNYREVTFTPIKDMRILTGQLEDLMSPSVYSLASTQDYIMAVLTDRGELMDPMSQLRTVYPNVLRLERKVFDREAGELKTSGEIFDEDKKTRVSDLFDDEMRQWRHEK